MLVAVVTPPEPVITPADVRRQLRLDATHEDEFLAGLIAAATAAIDGPAGWLGRAIGEQTLEAQLDGFYLGGRAEIALPYPPVIAIEAVTYDDAAGTAYTVPSASYGVFAGRGVYLKPGYVWPLTTGAPGCVRVRYRAGYPTAPAVGDVPMKSTVPAPILSAIALGIRELLTVIAQDPALRSEQVDGVMTRSWTISADTNTPLRQTMERLLGPFRVFA